MTPSMKKCSSSDTFLTTWSQLRSFLNKTTTIFRHYGCSSERSLAVEALNHWVFLMCLASEMATKAIESVQVKWLGVTASQTVDFEVTWRAVWHSQDYCLLTCT